MTVAAVALGEVATSRRRDVLSWSHHREVAALDAAELLRQLAQLVVEWQEAEAA